jgi:hypothetical protein
VRRPRASEDIGSSRHSSGGAPRASATARALGQGVEIALQSFGGFATRLRPREQRRGEVAAQALGAAPGLAAIVRPT